MCVYARRILRDLTIWILLSCFTSFFFFSFLVHNTHQLAFYSIKAKKHDRALAVSEGAIKRQSLLRNVMYHRVGMRVLYSIQYTTPKRKGVLSFFFQYKKGTKRREQNSKDECDRRITGTDARPTSSFRFRLERSVFPAWWHPRYVPDQSAACHDPIVHLASTPTASWVLHAGCHMQRGVELRGLEEKATFERWVERHARRCVSRRPVKD